MKTENRQYSFAKSAGKTVSPLVVLLIINAAKAALKQAGIDMQDDELYKIGLLGYAGYRALVNWIKNRKK